MLDNTEYIRVLGSISSYRNYVYSILDATITYKSNIYYTTEENKKDIKIYASSEMCSVLEINDEFHVIKLGDLTSDFNFENTPFGTYKGIPVYRVLNMVRNFVLIQYKGVYRSRLLFEELKRTSVYH